MRTLIASIFVGLRIAFPCGGFAEDPPTSRLLLITHMQDIQQFLPKDTLLLHDSIVIEKFLTALDGSSPNWAELHGNPGADHNDMLFALNRERDRLRASRPALLQRITFLWEGVLSSYLPDYGGFLVAVGPEIIDTKWGLVRFKPESLYTELVAVPHADIREPLLARVANGERVTVVVAMTGRLAPNEALIYDFAHEDPSQGMIMPMVQVEQIDYFLMTR